MRNPYLSNPDLFLADPGFRDHIFLDAESFAGYLRRPWTEPFSEALFTADLLRNRMLNELFHEAVPVILHEDDLNAMYFSIENRSPFLDRPLFEFCNTIPTRHLIRDGRAKAVLREAVRGIAPDAVLDNPRKVGFNAPIFSFLDVRDRAVRAELLDDSPIFEHVRRDRIETLIDRASICRTARASSCSTSSTPRCSSRSSRRREVLCALRAAGYAAQPRDRRRRRVQRVPRATDQAEIDWARARAGVRDVVARAKAQSAGYDCLIPVSGGKDSTWQVVTCLEYGLNPLAVTWKTPGRTAIGARNLDNLVSLGVDHIDYQVSPKVEKKFLYQALVRYGATAIPMHMALFNIPLTIAVRFEIPLVVWGENSAFEYGGTDDERMGFRLDGRWLQKIRRDARDDGARLDRRRSDGARSDRLQRPGRRRTRTRRDACGVSRLLLPVGSGNEPRSRLRARVSPARRGAEDRLLRLRRHRRRLHLDPSLVEVVQVRLHAAVRQPVARDPQRPHERDEAFESFASAATRRRTRTSRSSVSSSACPPTTSSA